MSKDGDFLTDLRQKLRLIENDQKPQHQGALVDQLKELHNLANQNGLYDAADWLRRHLEDHSHGFERTRKD